MSTTTSLKTTKTDGNYPVLVTGGSGFLGEHLLRALRDSGRAVRVLSRQPVSSLKDLVVSQYSGDILAPSGDGGQGGIADDLVAALDGCREVYHLAGLVSRDPQKAGEMMRLHVDGTRNLLQAAKAAGVRRVVLASTSGTIAISKSPTPIPDESFPYPVELCGNWPYYLSKIYQEKLALDLGARLGLEIVCVNPSLLLGPGDRRGSSTEDVRKFLCGEIAAIPSGGLSFVDVRDAALACVAAMERGRPGARYLLGGPNFTFAEFLSRLGRIAKVEGPWLRVPAGWNSLVNRVTRAVDHVCQHRGVSSPIDRVSFEMGQVFWYCDSSLARRELGFTTRDPAETLDDTVRDVRSTLRY